MGNELENLGLAASLRAAVGPRFRAAARESEGHALGAAQLHGGTVLCLSNARGIVLHISPNAKKVLGDACERAGEFGLTLGALFQPDDPTDVDQLIERYIRTQPGEVFSTALL